jgi:hypothetical protein
LTAGQQALDDAIKQCKFLQTLIRKKSTKQVWSDDERGTIKGTCLSWFNNHKPKVLPELDANVLPPADIIYDRMLTASERAGSRSQYNQNIKSLHSELLKIRSKQMAVASRGVATSDLTPNFAVLIPDPKMQSILENRWNECVLCLHAPAPMAATVMMGGLLEGLLLARVNKETNKQPIFTAKASPKDAKTGNPLQLKDWTLKDYIDVVHELKWITVSAKDVGGVLRDYRNYIHPQKELSHGVKLVPDDAGVLWEVAKSISKQLLK